MVRFSHKNNLVRLRKIMVSVKKYFVKVWGLCCHRYNNKTLGQGHALKKHLSLWHGKQSPTFCWSIHSLRLPLYTDFVALYIHWDYRALSWEFYYDTQGVTHVTLMQRATDDFCFVVFCISRAFSFCIKPRMWWQIIRCKSGCFSYGLIMDSFYSWY